MFKDLKNDIVRGGALTMLIATIILIYIVANVFPFLMNWQIESEIFIHQYLAFPSSLHRFITHPWTIITYAFFHADVFHILFNMFALYFFGDVLQDFIGRKHILSVFVISSAGGALLYFLFYNVFPKLQISAAYSDLIGASAGVMGILIAATTITPDLPIGFLLWRELKLKYVAVLFLIVDIVSLVSSNTGGHISHLGGMLAGWIYIKQLQNGNNLGAWLQFDFSKIKNRKKFQVHRNDNFIEKKVDAKKTNEEKLNKILEKISASGYESLSNEEKDFLKKYSNS
jgi:membrane associated rhomboid family serine protease